MNILTYSSVWTLETIIVIFIIITLFCLFYIINEILERTKKEVIDVIILKANGCMMCQNILSIMESLANYHFKISVMDISDFVLSLSEEEKTQIQSISTPTVLIKTEGEYKKLNNLAFLINYHEYQSLKNKNVLNGHS